MAKKKPHGNTKKYQQAIKTIKKIDRRPRGGPRNAMEHLLNHGSKHQVSSFLQHLDDHNPPGSGRTKALAQSVGRKIQVRKAGIKVAKKAVATAKAKTKGSTRSKTVKAPSASSRKKK